MKILYGVSPIGLGHASRAVAIASRLVKRGFEVEFATGSAASSFLASYGYKVHDIVREPVPIESEGRILFSTLWYVRYWFGYRRSRSRMLRLVEEMKPDLVIGDEEFSSVSIALEKRLRHAMITDERELGFARSLLARKAEARVMDWYSNLQRTVSCLIVPDFGTDELNVRYVTPVVRDVTMNRTKVLEHYGLPDDARIITCSMSGSGLGRYLAEATIRAFNQARLDGTVLVVVGGDARPLQQKTIYHLGFIRDNQDLIASSHLVISLAGKSTIDEANSFGVPIIAIPLKNHFEQERNARSLGFSFDDIHRLKPLMADYVGRTPTPQNYRGADIAAELLASLAQT